MTLRFKECPTIVKEILIQNELAIVSPKIFDEEKDRNETTQNLQTKSK